MKGPTRWSTRGKLVAIILASSFIPIAAGLSALAVLDTRSFRRQMVANAEVVASTVAQYSAAELAFRDEDAAQSTLATLADFPYLEHAALYDLQGRLFVRVLQATTLDNGVAPTLDSPPRLMTSWIEGNHLEVLVPVSMRGNRYGTLRMRISTSPLEARIRDYTYALLLIAASTAAFSLVLALGLQRFVSRPILALSAVARRVSGGDYTVRALKMTEDEVGGLCDAFNAMLAAIERRQRDAEAAIRVRDNFLSIASHELNTPLTAFKLQLQLLERHLVRPDPSRPPPRPEDLQRRLNLLGNSLQRFGRLVGDLLDVSRIDAGRLPLHLEEVDLAEVVEEVAERFRESFARGDTPLIVEVEHGAVGRWDRIRLDQVVTNLLSNALKFGGNQPVEIRVAMEASTAQLVVTDRGIGIAPEDANRIFGRYERAVSVQSYGGLGLGLFISRTIVESLGGHIEVESHAGRGTTFTVTLAREGPPEPPWPVEPWREAQHP